MVAAAVSGPQAPYMSDRLTGWETVFRGWVFGGVEKDFETVARAWSKFCLAISGVELGQSDYKRSAIKRPGHLKGRRIVLFDPEQ